MTETLVLLLIGFVVGAGVATLVSYIRDTPHRREREFNKAIQRKANYRP